MVLAGINMTETGTILLLTSVLASLVECISPCHIEGIVLLFESEWVL